MPEEINPIGRRECEVENSILRWLTGGDGGGSQVALVADLERNFKNAIEVTDGLARLDRAGLIHFFDDGRLVIATNQAVVAGEIYDHAL